MVFSQQMLVGQAAAHKDAADAVGFTQARF